MPQSPEVPSTACLFCRIVAGAVPAARVAESARCLAIRDIAPQAPVHCLVLPKAHVGSLEDMPGPALLGELVELAQAVARREGIADAGYRLVINTGADGGQTVGHLHLHVLGGRRLNWPPG